MSKVKNNPAVNANGKVFEQAITLIDKLHGLRNVIVQMATNNDFSADQRLNYLNQGISLVPEVLEYINNSTNALMACGLLLADHEDYIKTLKSKEATEE